MDDGREDKSLVKGTAENSIKPGFQGGSGGGEAPTGLRVDGKAKPGEGAEGDARAKARRELKESEASAGETPEKTGEGAESAKAGEEKAGGFYSGAGKGGTSKGEKGKGKGKLGSRFLKKGPIIGIIMGICGFGGVMFGAQMFLPFSLIAQFQETFNSMHVSANYRSNRLIYLQMDTGRVKDPIKKSIFGGQKFTFSNKQIKKLAEQGIVVDKKYEVDGKNYRVMIYTDNDGVERIVTADEKTAKKLSAKGLNANSFDAEYSGHQVFHEKFNTGSQTWRGQISGWYGTVTDKFLKHNKISRNRMANYEQKNDIAESKAEVQKIMEEGTENYKEPGSKLSVEQEDENGNVIKAGDDDNPDRLASYSEDPTTNQKPKTEEEVSKKLHASTGKYAGATSLVSMTANGVCAVVSAIGAINLMVAASETAQILSLASAYLETVDKVKAGYGDESPIHVLSASLVEKGVNKHIQLVDTGVEVKQGDPGANISGEEMATLTSEISYSNKSPMESAGMAALFDGGQINPNDPSVASFNISASSNKIMNGLGMGIKSYMGCLTARITAAGVNFAIKGVELAACLSTGFGCAILLADIASSLAMGAALAAVITGVVSTLVPKAANAMTRNFENLVGEDRGNAVYSGTHEIMGYAHLANGGSLATKEKYQQFGITQQKVIADNARYERERLSPFDLTSKYTFLGSIMTRMMSFATSSSLMSTLNTANSVVSSSAIALVEPVAFAYDVAEYLPDMEEYEKVAPDLASINAVGDPFPDPYIMTDPSTINYDPAYEVIDPLYEAGNFKEENTSDDNVIIKGDSDLAKYILFCTQRESPFGVTDQNIADAVTDWGKVRTENSNLDIVLNSTIGSVDIVGDVFDILQSQQELNNVGYITGESCVAGNTVENAEAPNWETAKVYQRFIEDQSLAESMGLIKESAVTAFLDDYYEQNPLDESYEGVLARKTGLRKDTVIALLDIIDYYNYVANYDPSERYAFGGDEFEVGDIEKPLNYNKENVLSGEVLMPNAILYRDIRNRSYAV